MKRMSTPAYRFPTDKDVTRMPQLAGPLLQFNLNEELQRLRVAESWQRGTGRSSKTLVKYPDFHVVLVLMRANTRMNEHHVDGRFSMHVLQGRLRVRLPEDLIEVSGGELIAVDYGTNHEVEALEESAFLLTISWPGGTKEERHAWKQSVP